MLHDLLFIFQSANLWRVLEIAALIRLLQHQSDGEFSFVKMPTMLPSAHKHINGAGTQGIGKSKKRAFIQNIAQKILQWAPKVQTVEQSSLIIRS